MGPRDRRLVQIVDSAVAESVRRSGDWVQCRAGCSHCCHGPFTVTSIDLARLREGLAAAPEELAVRLQDRGAEARLRMQAGFPGDWETGIVRSEAEADAFDKLHPWLPCPVLDVETGACTLHEHRPVACRLHGSAMRLNGMDLRHCSLNYAGASTNEVEACRVSLSMTAEQDEAVAEFEASGGESHLTYIAWAMR